MHGGETMEFNQCIIMIAVLTVMNFSMLPSEGLSVIRKRMLLYSMTAGSGFLVFVGGPIRVIVENICI